ncbi:DUF805 domain-containing protein [Microbulbifer guangxiensis]|uniref:DUF805 domain-containing protein n=1 Tax=Microbulbifer guangxiensis TaxID=2904249 RepID=UPI001F3E4E1B|nr:DUF805 domain-containing protein [Microbulbifer guangxiensis]
MDVKQQYLLAALLFSIIPTAVFSYDALLLSGMTSIQSVQAIFANSGKHVEAFSIATALFFLNLLALHQARLASGYIINYRRIASGSSPYESINEAKSFRGTAIKLLVIYFWMPGRMSRSDYLVFGILIPLLVTLYLLSYVLFNAQFATGDGKVYFAQGALTLTKVIPPLLVISPAVKRFHDIGRSGFYALTFLIPLIGIFIWLGMALIPPATKPAGNREENFAQRTEISSSN